MAKTAILLFNLGGPDSPDAVRPFLFNLFNDPAIIRLPWVLRFLIATLISRRRAKIAQEIYAKIGGRSPILENTKKQAEALERKLGTSDAKCFVAMRYWHPFVEEIVEEVKDFAPEQVILLPLYPQFSTTTTASSFASWDRAARKAGVNVPTKRICCYPDEPGFIGALASLTRAVYEKAMPYGRPRVLFSAHGLPEKIVAAGDPYPLHCAKTVEALRRELAIDDLDSVLCYQSRVGPLAWIGPSTDAEIKRAGSDRAPVVVVPIAFVSEHSETLVEIDIDYRRLAQASGVPFFAYSGAVGDDAVFIEGLAGLVRRAMADGKACFCGAGARGMPRRNGLLSDGKKLMPYLWLKALHLIAVISWMAGMLYLPRLFVYHADAKPGSELAETLKIMERRLLRIIMNPAMILTFVFGIALLAQNPDLLHQPFMHAKIGLVLVLAGLHGYLARCRKAFARDQNRHPARFYRILNEAPTVLMMGIVVLVIVRPF